MPQTHGAVAEKRLDLPSESALMLIGPDAGSRNAERE
jgi:hypothetical protein